MSFSFNYFLLFVKYLRNIRLYNYWKNKQRKKSNIYKNVNQELVLVFYSNIFYLVLYDNNIYLYYAGV
jgi:hypothetical protein